MSTFKIQNAFWVIKLLSIMPMLSTPISMMAILIKFQRDIVGLNCNSYKFNRLDKCYVAPLAIGSWELPRQVRDTKCEGQTAQNAPLFSVFSRHSKSAKRHSIILSTLSPWRWNPKLVGFCVKMAVKQIAISVWRWVSQSVSLCSQMR